MTNISIFSYIYSVANIVIIGGGAAGCFCAAVLSTLRPGWNITVLEAGKRPMAKLAVTGGGRCNITNTFEGTESLQLVYPRGYNLMKKALGRFGWRDCLEWFAGRGVAFTIQPDHCVFPESQDAMQIVHVLENEMKRGGVHVQCDSKIYSLDQINPRPDAIVITTGGGTAEILSCTGLSIEDPVPSLFTFKIDDSGIKELMGTVVQDVTLGIAGTKFRSHGTLLLTDWGISGPATLRLSSYAARHLAQNGYKGSLLVNWLGLSIDEASSMLSGLSKSSGRTIANSHPSALTDRLWRMLVSRAGIRPDCRWDELGSKGLARLLNVLCSDTYAITGRARFKEEFVTCGGVSLSEVNPATMEARSFPGLFFAGEVLDIDAVTGGFNLQAAWSTAWIAAHSIAEKY
ncbi:MAG: aminoacetone oxidase family FAD-binding enzyme [Bacteroidales bacterium]|nr:aminoacetone oxidase family FAD-binding enzyme [Bacteroidales bacterium]